MVKPNKYESIGTKMRRIISSASEESIKELRKGLYEYQETSLAELQHREKVLTRRVGDYTVKSHIVIYADKKSAGKTRVITALLYEDKMKQRARCMNPVLNFWYPGYIVTSTQKHTVIGLHILIVGPSLIGQWSDELARWGLNHTIVSTISSIPSKILTKDRITIVSTAVFSDYWKFHGFGPNKCPMRIVYDEPDTAHIPNCPNIDYCQSLILVSATSEGLAFVKGKNHYIRSLFISMTPFMRNLLTVKQPDAIIDNKLQIPPVIHRNIRFKPNGMMDAIAGALPPEIRDMILNGAIDDAYKALGVDSTSKDNLISIATRRLKFDIEKIESSIQLYGHNEARDKSLKEATQRLADMETRIKDNSKEDCRICYIPITNCTVCPSCYVGYCRECIYQWCAKKSACPSCQAPVELANLISVVDKDEIVDDDEKKEDEVVKKPSPSDIFETRSDALANILQFINAEHHNPKVLCFSGYEQTANDILKEIKKISPVAGSFATLKGTTKTRNDKIEMFRRGHMKYLVVDSRMDAAGLNLPETTHIVIYHNMPQNVEDQLIGRGNRLGRVGSLVVYHIVSD